MENQKLRIESVYRNSQILLLKQLLAEWKTGCFTRFHAPKRPKTATRITFFKIVGSKFVFGEIVALSALYLALKFWTISRKNSLYSLPPKLPVVLGPPLVQHVPTV